MKEIDILEHENMKTNPHAFMYLRFICGTNIYMYIYTYLSLTVLVVSRTLLGGDGVACRLEGTHVPKGIVTETLGQHGILRPKLREAHSVIVAMSVVLAK